MRSKLARFMLVLAPLTMVIVANGLTSPVAFGQEGLRLTIISQPADAVVGQTITSVPLNPDGAPVRVRATRTIEGTPSPAPGVLVDFKLATGLGLATGALTVVPQVTDTNGIATFGPGTLSIDTENEPTFTDFKLIAFATEPDGSAAEVTVVTTVESAPSRGFDIFEDGCRGSGCSVTLRGGLDVYTTTQNVRLAASELDASTLPGMACRNQRLVFPGSVFVHETSGSGAVGLVNHITLADPIGEGGGGGAAALSSDDDDDGPRIGWCVGTKTRRPWLNNGGSFIRQDTNGEAPGGVLFVGLAPRCPENNPRAFAPCIVSRRSDGEGGLILRGWLPGGDPPRRT